MKKNYSKPTVFVVELQRLCSSVPVTSVDGNADVPPPKSDAEVPNPQARSRQARFSIDEWEE